VERDNRAGSAEGAWLSDDFPLEPAVLAAITDQAVA